MRQSMSQIVIRAAVAADQRAIRHIVGQARLNPMGLDWPRFVVAEEHGWVIGVGQIKLHGDGTRELASLAIVPEWQSAGIGSVLVWTLMARAPGPLYLRCASHNEGYYQRFGFRTLSFAEMPPSHRRIYRVVNGMMRVVKLIAKSPDELLIMGRDLGR